MSLQRTSMMVALLASMATMATMASLAGCALAPASQSAYPLPTPVMQAIVDKDTRRHFGDAPADGGPLATDLSAALQPAAIERALRKVADWQLARTQQHIDRIWTSAVLYTGFMAASDATGDAKYRDAMLAMSQGFNWDLKGTYPNADDLSVAQTYLELYALDPSPDKLLPVKAHLDQLIGLKTLTPNDRRAPWWWCDALFMAPPVWAKMYQATGERKYLDYVHEQWRVTYDLLYDQDEHLYARDASYIDQTEHNGKKIFWSRGEGWVLGGLARTIDFIPPDDPQRPFYLRQLRDMAAKIATLQNPQGLWHAGLLDPATYPLAETSGSALFVYGMAYGVNRGYLDQASYRPVIEKAWAGLLGHVYADGRLGGIQQTGAEPAFYRPASSYNYGVGGFLLAAAEVKRLAEGTKVAVK